ncbi:MAG: hypothetical protein LUC44_02870 [Prevotellaceae bacterium]|nr:hypothetical protein [Prevotellaceae bacterium]
MTKIYILKKVEAEARAMALEMAKLQIIPKVDNVPPMPGGSHGTTLPAFLYENTITKNNIHTL